ncbi:MAG: NUDIX hydrolase [Eisenbergiella massiliensis]
MRLLRMKNIHEGAYLKHYELTYLNKSGKEKVFELVSRNRLASPRDIGRKASGVTIIAFQKERMLLLREFRMSINKSIYNLCAGMLQEGESVEDCARRELYEETGLTVARFLDILPPSYSAVGFSDTGTYMVILEAEGTFSDHTSANEEITAGLYTREELKAARTEEFSSRSRPPPISLPISGNIRASVLLPFLEGSEINLISVFGRQQSA